MMGTEYGAICKKCHTRFRVSEGGGFMFHLLHCDKCGKPKSLSFVEIGEPHLRYLKGLSGPYSIATQEHDKNVQETYPGEPLSEAEYNLAIEKLAGKCGCGGYFKLDAPPRCPKCKSPDFKKDPKGNELLYD
jgi:hypothetical protein